MSMKKCSSCQMLKNTDLFGKSKSEKDGFFSYCKVCKRQKDREHYAKNPKRGRLKTAKYKETFPDRVLVSKKRDYLKNAEKYRTRAKNYYALNKDDINNKNKELRKKDPFYYAKIYAKVKKRKAEDPAFRAITNVRQRVAAFLKSSTSKVSDKLGCTKAQLVSHLESQFQPGMTWENYGKWHIDHKISLHSAWQKGPECFKQACNYINLQPLWAIDNIRKGKK